MKKRIASFLLVLSILAFISGCASSVKDYPAYDQVLLYDKAYDYTYLKVLEALNTFREWAIEETDKEKGLIVLRNTQYGHLFDHDKWVARFNVKRLGRKKTSVSLDPSTQRIEQGGELLRRIDQVMLMAASTKGEALSEAVN